MYYSFMYYMKVFIPVGEGEGRRREGEGGAFWFHQVSKLIERLRITFTANGKRQK